MGDILKNIESEIQRAEQRLDEANFRIEACLDADSRNATAALEEIESARFCLEDIRRSITGLSSSHSDLENEVQTLREMMAEYEAENAELKEAVRYMSGDPDEPVDDWKGSAD